MDEKLLTPREREFLDNNPSGSYVEPPSNPTASPELVGVGGWLAFLVVSLSFIGPLVTLGRTATDIAEVERSNPGVSASSEWSSMVAMAWIYTAIYCIISIFAGYRLYNHHVPKTVQIVIACLWIAGPGLTIIGLILIGSDQAAITDLVRSSITAGIWSAYLLISKRVKNTYSDRHPNSQLAATFE